MIAISKNIYAPTRDVSRRQFLRTTGLTTGMGIGLLSLSGCDWWCKLLGSCNNCDPNNIDLDNSDCQQNITDFAFSFHCNGILDCVTNFAINIGSQVLGQLFKDFQKNLLPEQQRRAKSANDVMSASSERFQTDVAPVYQKTDPKVQTRNMFFYAAPSGLLGSSNACAAFVADSTECNNRENPDGTPIIEGPSLLTLATLSQAYTTNSKRTPDQRYDLLAPSCVEQVARGGFNQSYSQAEIIRTRGGRLQVDYDWVSGDALHGTGLSHVVLEEKKNGSYKKLWDKTWDLVY